MQFEMSLTKPDKLTPNNKKAGPFVWARHLSPRGQIVAAIASVVVAPFAGTLIVLIDCALVLVARGTVAVGTPATI
jgi:hypothetical protein